MDDLIAGEFIDDEAIHIKHADLKRVGDSAFKSECPKCKKGMLLVMRDQKTLELLSADRCVLCGQAFIYDDLGVAPSQPQDVI